MAHAFGGWGPGIRFSDCPPEHQQIWAIFAQTVKAHNTWREPWGRHLAGRPTSERAEVEAQHQLAIAAASEALSAAYRELLLDLMERIWGLDAERGVSAEDLKHEGFDPAPPEPDGDHYW
jgi:hypothetical protein